MKKLIIILFLVAGSALFFSSCKKALSGSQLDYVGTWYSDSGFTKVVINANGTGSYNYADFSSTVNISGKVKIKNNTLRIGGYILKKTLSIDAAPSLNSLTGKTNMTLSGEVYEKQ